MKNLKKVVALLLAVLMLSGMAVMFSSCGKVTSENPGAIIDLYMPYAVSLDPAVAYADDTSSKLLSLLYEGLTTITSKGKLEGALADEWETYTDRDGNKVLEIKLKTTRWSDGTLVDAEDFLDSWERILDPAFNCQAASLLFPIKNAVAVKTGDKSISDLGIQAQKDTLLIILEDWADPDTFLRNCASVALYPVRKDVINKIYDRENQKENDWSTLIAIMVSNGPFFLKGVSFGNQVDGISNRPYIVLERNTNYYLDPEKNQSLDKYVVPYRININMTYGNDERESFIDSKYKIIGTTAKIESTIEEIKATMTEEEIAAITAAQFEEMAVAKIRADIADTYSIDYLDSILKKITQNKLDYITIYDEGKVQYSNSFPLTEEVSGVKTADTMMTGTFLFNTNNEALANAKVRQALSLALDREHIASLVKYAKAADTLVTNGVFETTRKTSFKKNADYGLSTTADEATAKKLINEAGVKKGTKLNLAIRASEMDILIAQYAKEVWEKLGFSVTITVYGYSVISYTEKQLLNSEELDPVTGKPIKTWQDVIIYDGLLHDNYTDAYNSGNFDVMLYDLNMLTTDAFPVLAQFASIYSGSAYDLSDPANFGVIQPHVTGYESKAYDDLLKQALVETDAAKRADLLHQAEALLLEDLPVTPIIYYQNAYKVSGVLDDYELDYFGAMDFTEATYDDYVPVVEEDEPEEDEGEGEAAAE